MAEINSTYNAVHDESITTWKFQRLGLVLEFAQSSIFPAPFGIFEDIWLLCSCRHSRGSLASSYGASSLWTATFFVSGRSIKAGCCITGGAESMTVSKIPALRYAQRARDWVEWMAAALVINQQHASGGLRGYFPQNWTWDLHTNMGVIDNCLNMPIPDGASVQMRNPNTPRIPCPCARCQALSLRLSADVVGEAVDAWARAQAEGDAERTAALEAARAAAAAAERTAQLQAAKVSTLLIRSKMALVGDVVL
jgi:hypothetical protein